MDVVYTVFLETGEMLISGDERVDLEWILTVIFFERIDTVQQKICPSFFLLLVLFLKFSDYLQ